LRLRGWVVQFVVRENLHARIGQSLDDLADGLVGACFVELCLDKGGQFLEVGRLGIFPLEEAVHDLLDPVRRRGESRCGAGGKLAERCDPSAGDVLGPEVLDERVEALVFGNDAEGGSRELSGEATYVISDVEIQSVGAGALNPDVFCVWSKGLEFGGEVERDFGLVRAAEDLGLEWVPTKLSQVFGLNVFEVDEDDVGIHCIDICLPRW